MPGESSSEPEADYTQTSASGNGSASNIELRASADLVTAFARRCGYGNPFATRNGFHDCLPGGSGVAVTFCYASGVLMIAFDLIERIYAAISGEPEFEFFFCDSSQCEQKGRFVVSQ